MLKLFFVSLHQNDESSYRDLYQVQSSTNLYLRIIIQMQTQTNLSFSNILNKYTSLIVENIKL